MNVNLSELLASLKSPSDLYSFRQPLVVVLLVRRQAVRCPHHSVGKVRRGEREEHFSKGVSMASCRADHSTADNVFLRVLHAQRTAGTAFNGLQRRMEVQLHTTCCLAFARPLVRASLHVVHEPPLDCR